MMMPSTPDLETLEAYVDGSLPAAERAEVRQWLIVFADESILAIVEAIHARVEHRRSRVSHWAARPLRARLSRLAWRARKAVEHSLEREPLGAPALAPLGAPRELPKRHGELTLEVSPGEPVELLVSVGADTWFAAYGLESEGAVRTLLPGNRHHLRGERVEAGGPTLDVGDDPIDLFVIFDDRGPLPAPPPAIDAEWVAALLERAASEPGMSVLRATIAVAPPEPGGKQT